MDEESAPKKMPGDVEAYMGKVEKFLEGLPEAPSEPMPVSKPAPAAETPAAEPAVEVPIKTAEEIQASLAKYGVLPERPVLEPTLPEDVILESSEMGKRSDASEVWTSSTDVAAPSREMREQNLVGFKQTTQALIDAGVLKQTPGVSEPASQAEPQVLDKTPVELPPAPADEVQVYKKGAKARELLEEVRSQMKVKDGFYKRDVLGDLLRARDSAKEDGMTVGQILTPDEKKKFAEEVREYNAWRNGVVAKAKEYFSEAEAAAQNGNEDLMVSYLGLAREPAMRGMSGSNFEMFEQEMKKIQTSLAEGKRADLEKASEYCETVIKQFNGGSEIGNQLRAALTRAKSGHPWSMIRESFEHAESLLPKGSDAVRPNFCEFAQKVRKIYLGALKEYGPKNVASELKLDMTGIMEYPDSTSDKSIGDSIEGLYKYVTEDLGLPGKIGGKDRRDIWMRHMQRVRGRVLRNKELTAVRAEIEADPEILDKFEEEKVDIALNALVDQYRSLFKDSDESLKKKTEEFMGNAIRNNYSRMDNMMSLFDNPFFGVKIDNADTRDKAIELLKSVYEVSAIDLSIDRAYSELRTALYWAEQKPGKRTMAENASATELGLRDMDSALEKIGLTYKSFVHAKTAKFFDDYFKMVREYEMQAQAKAAAEATASAMPEKAAGSALPFSESLTPDESPLEGLNHDKIRYWAGIARKHMAEGHGMEDVQSSRRMLFKYATEPKGSKDIKNLKSILGDDVYEKYVAELREFFTREDVRAGYCGGIASPRFGKEPHPITSKYGDLTLLEQKLFTMMDNCAAGIKNYKSAHQKEIDEVKAYVQKFREGAAKWAKREIGLAVLGADEVSNYCKTHKKAVIGTGAMLVTAGLATSAYYIFRDHRTPASIATQNIEEALKQHVKDRNIRLFEPRDFEYGYKEGYYGVWIDADYEVDLWMTVPNNKIRCVGRLSRNGIPCRELGESDVSSPKLAYTTIQKYLHGLARAESNPTEPAPEPYQAPRPAAPQPAPQPVASQPVHEPEPESAPAPEPAPAPKPRTPRQHRAPRAARPHVPSPKPAGGTKSRASLNSDAAMREYVEDVLNGLQSDEIIDAWSTNQRVAYRPNASSPESIDGIADYRIQATRNGGTRIVYAETPGGNDMPGEIERFNAHGYPFVDAGKYAGMSPQRANAAIKNGFLRQLQRSIGSKYVNTD